LAPTLSLAPSLQEQRTLPNKERLLERSHLDHPDPLGPDLTSGPYLILQEQVVELLKQMLSSFGSSLHLVILRVRLVAVVMHCCVLLVVIASARLRSRRKTLFNNLVASLKAMSMADSTHTL